VDDEAQAAFNGHIIVQKDAQRTAAYQINKNIALTDEARVKTQPFLEIYADDVKCSHGATVGQLDENAMFYLRSRGICQKNARMLLMFAFANEVAQTVTIQPLRERLSQMIQQRLRGELHICSQCALHCEENREISFG
jgi:Fe-S cluster assembly protein SufD